MAAEKNERNSREALAAATGAISGLRVVFLRTETWICGGPGARCICDTLLTGGTFSQESQSSTFSTNSILLKAHKFRLSILCIKSGLEGYITNINTSGEYILS